LKIDYPEDILMSQICKVKISWKLISTGQSGEIDLEYRKFPLDDELKINLMKKFKVGELTGRPFIPKKNDLQVEYRRRYFEGNKEIHVIW
jgi:hypothetical protein